uniref:Uncharacterized protein n=1 Tax=Acrobeloides nanus TaxID=290746 RepID=A0A914E3D6_9BILA
KIQHLENDLKQARAIIRTQDVEKNQIKAENQELRTIIAALQAQMAQLVRATEVSSDAEIIDVEKVDEEKVTNSVENVSNMMQNATISQEPMYFNSDMVNLLRMVSPEFDREVHNILNSPLTSPLNQVLDQQQQAKPPLIVKKDKTTIQYAPKPGSLILDDGFEHNPAKYHSPLFQKIVYQFYGESPIKLVNPVTSTSKENQK